MKVISLQSGSNGNCIYVEAGDVRLLFDAGISGEQAKSRLAACGRDIHSVHALVISHDHRDHTCCLGVFQRKFKLPAYITQRTFAAVKRGSPSGTFGEMRFFQSDETFEIGNVRIETIRTPHDAADGVAFIVDDGTCRLGIMTDLGHAFEKLMLAMSSLDAALIESNYDCDMLARGPYPAHLKRRIVGPRGHLSNVDAAELIRDTAKPRLQWVCLAHLSAENNHPDIARQTHTKILGDRIPLFVANRDQASDVLEVRPMQSSHASLKPSPDFERPPTYRPRLFPQMAQAMTAATPN